MGSAKKRSVKKRKRKQSIASTLLLVALLLAGVGIMAYPTVSDWWNSLHQTQAIASYVSKIESVEDERANEVLEAARAYNATLPGKKNPFAMYEEDLARYNELLDITGTGIMGYIAIPAINVNLPIYHGTDESVLQIAAGHLNWSSLPVGGKSTHAVLSGHRGLPSARLFTDLDRLTLGDTFTITVLKETMTYMIDQIRIVEPSEINDLLIQEGMDYVTLVTCTPYGINTHRILVRGHRIENEREAVVVTVGAFRISNYIAILVIGIPMLFVFLLALLIFERVRRAPHSELEIEGYYEDWANPSEEDES